MSTAIGRRLRAAGGHPRDYRLDTIAVDFSANPDINTANFDGDLTSVTDLTVTVNMAEPNMDEVSLVLIPPNGLTPVTLLLNRLDGQGRTLPLDVGQSARAEPGGTGLLNSQDLGAIQVQVNNPWCPGGIWYAVGTVFDDSAPRSLNEPANTYTQTVVAPYVGEFKPEVGSLRALLNDPNFLADAAGNWTLEITDVKTRSSGSGPTAVPPKWF